jgi:hypothetical protein
VVGDDLEGQPGDKGAIEGRKRGCHIKEFMVSGVAAIAPLATIGGGKWGKRRRAEAEGGTRGAGTR